MSKSNGSGDEGNSGNPSFFGGFHNPQFSNPNVNAGAAASNAGKGDLAGQIEDVRQRIINKLREIINEQSGHLTRGLEMIKEFEAHKNLLETELKKSRQENEQKTQKIADLQVRLAVYEGGVLARGGQLPQSSQFQMQFQQSLQPALGQYGVSQVASFEEVASSAPENFDDLFVGLDDEFDMGVFDLPNSPTKVSLVEAPAINQYFGDDEGTRPLSHGRNPLKRKEDSKEVGGVEFFNQAQLARILKSSGTKHRSIERNILQNQAALEKIISEDGADNLLSRDEFSFVMAACGGGAEKIFAELGKLFSHQSPYENFLPSDSHSGYFNARTIAIMYKSCTTSFEKISEGLNNFIKLVENVSKEDGEAGRKLLESFNEQITSPSNMKFFNSFGGKFNCIDFIADVIGIFEEKFQENAAIVKIVQDAKGNFLREKEPQNSPSTRDSQASWQLKQIATSKQKASEGGALK